MTTVLLNAFSVREATAKRLYDPRGALSEDAANRLRQLERMAYMADHQRIIPHGIGQMHINADDFNLLFPE